MAHPELFFPHKLHVMQGGVLGQREASEQILCFLVFHMTVKKGFVWTSVEIVQPADEASLLQAQQSNPAFLNNVGGKDHNNKSEDKD